MPDVAGGLQLLPETRKKIDLHMPGQNKLLFLALFFLALIAIVYLLLLGYKNSLLSAVTSIDSQLAELEKSRDKKLEFRLLDLQKQLLVINPIIDSHVFWSEALGKIQSVIQPQVQVQLLNSDMNSKKVVIKGLASSYTTVARQIAAFYTMEAVTDITLNKIQAQPTGKVEFTMEVKFDVNKFLLKGGNQ